MSYIFPLLLFFWISLHTSQSLIDLADFLIVVTAFTMAFKNQDLKRLFQAFRPTWLWPIWFVVVILGFVFGAPTEMTTALHLILEYRWFLSFLCLLYINSQLEWNDQQIDYLILSLFLYSVIDFGAFFIYREIDPRAGGLFQHSMPFAHSMGPATLLLLFVSLKKLFGQSTNFYSRVIYFLMPAMAISLVVLTMTRGIWLGFFFALLAATFMWSRKAFLNTLMILVIAGAGLFFGVERIQNRVMGKTKSETKSNQERMLYWKANLQMLEEYPLFGIGYSQNNVHVEEYLKKDGVKWLTGGHAHNQYIHYLAGTGLLGFLCFMTFLGGLFWPVLLLLRRWQKQKKFDHHFYLLLGAFAGMLCFIIGSLTESNFSIAKNRFMFLFIAAIAYSFTQKHKTKES